MTNLKKLPVLFKYYLTSSLHAWCSILVYIAVIYYNLVYPPNFGMTLLNTNSATSECQETLFFKHTDIAHGDEECKISSST